MTGCPHRVALGCPDAHAAFYSRLLEDPVIYTSDDWVVLSTVAATTQLVLALGAGRLDVEDVFADPAAHPICLVSRPAWAGPISP